MSKYLLTTTDNPHNPHNNFEAWLAYDLVKHHNTCGRLDDASFMSDGLSESDSELELQRAMDFVCNNQFSVDGEKRVDFIKVTEDDDTLLISKVWAETEDDDNSLISKVWGEGQ